MQNEATDLSSRINLEGKSIAFKDNSRLKECKRCLRSYFFQYEKHLVPDKLQLALDFGTCWHAAMDRLYDLFFNKNLRDLELAEEAYKAFLETWIKLGLPPTIGIENEKQFSPRTPGIAKEMLINYINTRTEWLSSCKLIEIEKPFAVSLDPNDPSKMYVGRIDKVLLDQQGMYVGIEHKTTTMYSIDHGIQASIVEAFSLDAQVDGYNFNLMMTYKEKYRGLLVDIALVHKVKHDVFRFVPVQKSMTKANQWIEDTIYWWQVIEQARETNHFPKNAPGGCRTIYGRCDYWILCTNTIDLKDLQDENPGYKYSKWEPFSFDELRTAIEEQKETTI